jgi:RecB family exonuclease
MVPVRQAPSPDSVTLIGLPTFLVEGLEGWTRAIVSLAEESHGPLASRTVIVPSQATAHALRRRLLQTDHAPVLIGTRFVTAGQAAREVLIAAGEPVQPGEEALRPARLLAAFADPPALAYFKPALLRTRPGWEDAFARTIADLEAAGATPDDIAAHANVSVNVSVRQRFADVAALWRVVESAAAASCTEAGLLRRAAATLSKDARAWPFDGPVLVAVTGHESAMFAAFACAIPDVRLGVLRARPPRHSHADRLRRLYGHDAGLIFTEAAPPTAAKDERSILAAFLFAEPEVLADAARPRSMGPDGHVHFEEHAGVDDELTAAVDGVAREIVDHGTPLEQIAILVPSTDPLAGMLFDRLAALKDPNGDPLPVHVMGGLPITRTAAGARILAVIRALKANLHVSALVGIAASLRTLPVEDGSTPYLTRSAVADVLYTSGTVGGSMADPRGALTWASRLKARSLVESDPYRAQTLRTMLPSIEALVEVARLIVDREPLGTIAPKLADFLHDWLLAPGEPGARVLAQVVGALKGLAVHGAVAALIEDAALETLENTVHALRNPTYRFGEPAITIGPIAKAAGLPFRATRILGLAEGRLPAARREDPVLPESLRAALHESYVLATPADRMLEQLHAVERVIEATSERVVLSMSRMDLDRTYREASAIVLEAAAAVARPDSRTGKHDPAVVIPGGHAIRRDAYEPSRRANAQSRLASPRTEAAWHDRAARTVELPARWRRDAGTIRDVAEVLALHDASAEIASLDGIFGATAAFPPLPGLTAATPLSASVARELLQCPHKFLFMRVLRWRPPQGAQDSASIGAMSYGSLFHRAAESFYETHGSAFGAREQSLAAWLATADTVLDATFTEFLGTYALTGETVQRAQRDRLRRDVRALLEYDWEGGPRRFVGVERSFGPLELPVGARSVFLHGAIDRIDVVDGVTVIRDLKTGKAHLRTADEMDFATDLQLALYGLVAEALATEWGTPANVRAAYVYPAQRGDRERAFDTDFPELATAARGWLGVAIDLLAARAFPRSTVASDCTFCDFKPVCGARERQRAAQLMAGGAQPALASYHALRHPLRAEAPDDEA